MRRLVPAAEARSGDAVASLLPEPAEWAVLAYFMTARTPKTEDPRARCSVYSWMPVVARIVDPSPDGHSTGIGILFHGSTQHRPSTSPSGRRSGTYARRGPTGRHQGLRFGLRVQTAVQAPVGAASIGPDAAEASGVEARAPRCEDLRRVPAEWRLSAEEIDAMIACS